MCWVEDNLINLINKEFWFWRIFEWVVDEDSDFEFEGFDVDDIIVSRLIENFENFIDVDNWVVGDREFLLFDYIKIFGLK